MGYEKSPPQNKIIAGLAVATALTLASLHFVFTSYFNSVTRRDLQSKVYGVTTSNVDSLKANASNRLQNGRVPVAQAMGIVGKGERPAELAPDRETDDLAALEGWAGNPAPASVVDHAKQAHLLFLYRQTQAALDAAKQTPGTDKQTIAELETKLAAHRAAIEAAGLHVPGTPGAEGDEPAAPNAQPNAPAGTES
ncbi:MAG: hypothetical protein KC417_17050, partial [Myxococcales bacterium]|nr:hypothetical protein [Myxococcales bacterium]